MNVRLRPSGGAGSALPRAVGRKIQFPEVKYAGTFLIHCRSESDLVIYKVFLLNFNLPVWVRLYLLHNGNSTSAGPGYS